MEETSVSLKIGLSDLDKQKMASEVFERAKVKGVVATVTDLPTNGSDKIYVVTENGHWYYYTDKWNDGGLYQGIEIANGSITPEKLSEDLHEILFLNTYLEDMTSEAVLSGKYVSNVDGGIYDNSQAYYTDYINVSTKDTFYISGAYRASTCMVATYDKDKNFIRKYGYGASTKTIWTDEEFTPQDDEKYVRFGSFEAPLIVKKLMYYTIAEKFEEVENEVEIIKNDIKVNDYYKKDISSEVVLTGYYVSADRGELVGDGNSQYTEYISIGTNDTYYISGHSQFSTCLIFTYDSTKTHLRSYGVNTENTSTGLISTDLEFKPKDDEKYVRFCSYQYKRYPLIVKKLTQYTINGKFEKLEESNGNVLYGKKYVACGDSFTEGDFTGFTDENGLSGMNSPYLYDSDLQMYKTYPYWIAKRNGMTLINEAKCGSDFTNIEGASNPFSLTRYLNVPKDADYITLMFGLNEVNLTTEQIGTKTDTTNATLWGAYNIVFEYFLTNMPYAKIGVIIPDAWMNKTYSNAVKEICEYWGIPYLDLKGDVKVPMGIGGRYNAFSSTANTLRNNAFRVSSSNNHPNLEAHKYRSTFIENFLRSL